MATHTQTFVTDDIDNSSDATTHTFSLDGEEWTIDLGSKNAEKLSQALAPFIEAGTKVPKRGRTTKTKSRTDLAEIRAWAKSQGIEVSERGRISAAVVEQYDASH